MAGSASTRQHTDHRGSGDYTTPSTDGLSTFHKAKIAFLVASFASLALSVGLWVMGNREQAIFVGIWVPSIHSLGTLVLTGESSLLSRHDREATR